MRDEDRIIPKPHHIESNGITFEQNAAHYKMHVDEYIQLALKWWDPHKPECINSSRWFNGIRRESGYMLGVPVGPDIIKLDGRHWPRVKSAGRSGLNRYLCTGCGRWVCDHCGHIRQNANRRYTGVFDCPRCKKTKGHWEVTYHTLKTWWNHNDAYVQLGSSAGMTTTKMAEGENASG